MSTEIMIVAGEASGDLHGSRLITAMRARQPDLLVSGIGGVELAAAGVDILFPSSKIAVVGFFEVISHLADIITAQKLLRRRLAEHRPRLLILIDFPDFNLMLAAKAKKLGIPVFYYISPQVWAWRSGRVKTIGRVTDTIGVILPFEEDFYRSRGVAAHYVGHPLLDSVRADISRKAFCTMFDIDASRPLIGILPGSRTKEIRQLLPIFLEAAAVYQRRAATRPVFLIPQASTVAEEELADNGVDRYRSIIDIRIITSRRYDLMAACDAVMAASGTVTLEVLLLGTPMVVAYKLSPLTYQIGRLLVNVPYFALVNLIAGDEVVPELLQNEARADRISDELYQLVHDPLRRARMKEDFARVRGLLGSAGASDRAADLAVSLIGGAGRRTTEVRQ
ncbi:lipid-A-disaccharide synthase [Desulfofustis glycolicus]|uniref:Lipid-A-disaccharide synthase n=1 Tax=Desulfofustis glycolicus DSM 9705 TaxID=1121409 RepID=A0A1M5U8A4_9BACT|nr:lipid-A-disaccharide synthase [Desulfofustis glycolicus]MCB2214596.1 lipid-A-disaccharide synthase [Desulfobulbaceae bacterium]SHH59179.1 lipid-A-disaccharide synthase [Desulfofustis glycolicus DSM 9705]